MSAPKRNLAYQTEQKKTPVFWLMAVVGRLKKLVDGELNHLLTVNRSKRRLSLQLPLVFRYLSGRTLMLCRLVLKRH